MLNSLSAKTTQDFIPVQEIRDGVLIMKNGGLRLVLIASSINFALKSADEQRGILLQYQNFLNSLDFTIQIFIQSRRLDIGPYINSLEDRLKEQPNDLIKVQTREYIDFIKNFTDNVNVMSKSFFIVVPYDPAIINQKKGGFLSKIFGQKTETESQKDFNESRIQLEQRVAVIQQGLGSIGIRVAPLGTEELIELYFKIYNPDEKQAPSLDHQPNKV